MIATNRKQLDNISYLTNAKVGIFWFLPATGTLFECHVQAVSDSNSVQNLITFPKLHKTIWTKKILPRQIPRENRLNILPRLHTNTPRPYILRPRRKSICRHGRLLVQNL